MSEFRTTNPADDNNEHERSAYLDVLPRGGFNFENCRRNEHFQHMKNAQGQRLCPDPIKFQKTGTTIVGVVYQGGVVLGADTRATGGSIVMDKNCEKIHYMAPNIYCCGAGTAADTENVTGMISSQLELLRMNTGTESRVVTAMTLLKKKLFQYQGYISAALVLGGVDVTGGHLYTVYPHGSTDKLPYVTMGSGSLAAMAIFEAGYKDGMTLEEAKKLVEDAIMSGVNNDLGSGSNVDITTITRVDGKTKVHVDRNYRTPNNGSALRNKIQRDVVTSIPRGATTVLHSSFKPYDLIVEDADAMQL